CAREAYYW
nr:immunoglobulin heavy chain junction region [Mus musculus]